MLLHLLIGFLILLTHLLWLNKFFCWRWIFLLGGVHRNRGFSGSILKTKSWILFGRFILFPFCRFWSLYFTLGTRILLHLVIHFLRLSVVYQFWLLCRLISYSGLLLRFFLFIFIALLRVRACFFCFWCRHLTFNLFKFHGEIKLHAHNFKSNAISPNYQNYFWSD